MSDIKIHHINFDIPNELNGKDIFLIKHNEQLIGKVTEDVLTIKSYTKEPIKEIVLKMVEQTKSDCVIFARDEEQLKQHINRSKRLKHRKIFY